MGFRHPVVSYYHTRYKPRTTWEDTHQRSEVVVRQFLQRCFRSVSGLWDIVGVENIHTVMSLGHGNKGRTSLIPIAHVSKLGIVGRITLDSLLEILGLGASRTGLP